MALGTLDAHAEKELTDRPGGFLGIGLDLEEAAADSLSVEPRAVRIERTN